MMQKNSFDSMPVPFCPKHAAPIKNMHILVTESATVPGTVDIIKFMTYKEAVGYKILGAMCHGESRQLDVPEGGVRSKTARVALHRFVLGIPGTHLTGFSIQEGDGEAADGDGP